MKKPKYISLLTLSILAATKVNAESPDELDLFSMSLEELSSIQVVNAVTGYEYKLNEAPASVSIIEASEWQARGNTTLSEALRGIVGVQDSVINGSNTEYQPIVRGLAGLFGQQIKLLIDGIAINRIHHGGTPALDIPLLGFKRIEVIKSPGSAIYGADAFAGIINLVSQESSETDSQFLVTTGKFDEYSLGYTGKADIKNAKIRYALNYHHYGDDPNRQINSDLQTGLDAGFGTSASNAPGNINQSSDYFSINLSANLENLDFSYFGMKGKFGFGAGVVESLDPEGEGSHHTHVAEIKYNFNSFGLENLTLSAWYQDKFSEFPFTIFPAGAVLPIGSDGNLNFTNSTTVTEFTDGYIGHPGNNSTLSQIALTQVFEPFANHRVRWQVGYEHHDHKPQEKKNFGPGILDGTETVVDGTLTDVTGTPYSFLPFKTRNFYFLSLQDNWQITEQLSIHLGGRFDHYSNFGDTVNPRTGFVWRANGNLTLKAFTASAFRAPSFYDLYGANNPVNLGNPNLKPEEITTNEFNLAYNFGKNLQTDITLYDYSAKELIEYAPVEGVAGLVATNQGKINGKGLEWQMRWRPTDKLDVKANYSRVISEDDAGNQRPNFSDNMASIAINYLVNERVNINLLSQYYDEQQRPVSDEREPVPSYVWTSIRASYELTELPVELSLTVNNLANEQGHFPSSRISEDYPIAGRQWMLQLIYQM